MAGGTRKPIQLVVYKRGSKAREKEKRRRVAPLKVLYNYLVT